MSSMSVSLYLLDNVPEASNLIIKDNKSYIVLEIEKTIKNCVLLINIYVINKTNSRRDKTKFLSSLFLKMNP